MLGQFVDPQVPFDVEPDPNPTVGMVQVGRYGTYFRKETKGLKKIFDFDPDPTFCCVAQPEPDPQTLSVNTDTVPRFTRGLESCTLPKDFLLYVKGPVYWNDCGRDFIIDPDQPKDNFKPENMHKLKYTSLAPLK